MFDVANFRFHYACQTGNVKVVKSFLAKDVSNVNIRFVDHGETPLMTAASDNQLEVIRLLLAKDDLDIAAVDNDGDTCLHWACHYGNASCIAVLGQDMRMTSQIINMKNSSGQTALLIAVLNSNLACLEELAKLEDVDWNIKNEKGEGLEDIARSNNKVKILQFFEQRKLESQVVSKGVSRVKKFKEAALNMQALDDDLEVKSKALASQQAEEVEELDKKLAKIKTVFDQKQTKELEELAKKHKEEKIEFSKSLGHQRSALIQIHEIECSKLKDKYTLNMKLLEDNILTLVSPPAPECPVCLESMPPPTQIFNCPNGHLECGICKQKVAKCSICMEPVMGRATAMEQMLRTLFNKE